jgi:predicted esterase
MNRPSPIPWLLAGFMALAGAASPSLVRAGEIVMFDGRRIAGDYVPLASMAGDRGATVAEPGAPAAQTITMIDTGLKRVYVPRRLVTEAIPGNAGQVFETISIRQHIGTSIGQVNNVSSIQGITPFDQFGRRTFTIATANGNIPVIQGITEITPDWTRVQGITHTWDMRIATNSIPFETLSQVIAQGVDPANEQERLVVARLLVRMRRYGDARVELEGILEDFPAMRDRVEPIARSLVQLRSRQILDEIELRRDAKQFVLARAMLEQFPVEGVAGEILEEVRRRTGELRAEADKAEVARKQFDALMAQLPEDRRRRVLPVRDEIFNRRTDLRGEDFVDPLRFCTRVAERWLDTTVGMAGETVIVPSPSRQIYRVMDEQVRADLMRVAETGTATREQGMRILAALDDCIRYRDFYSPEAFATVAVSDEAKELIARDRENLTDPEIERLNRLLFEAAFPEDIRRSSFTGLTFNTLPRLEPFLQLAEDRSLQPEQKLALAVSGWLVGPKDTQTQFAVAMSLFEVRNLIDRYLAAGTHVERQEILSEIARREAGTPAFLHKLLAQLAPPLKTVAQQLPGYYELQVDSGLSGEAPATYFVQLPPEYDPSARYPAIVTLNGTLTVAGNSVIRPTEQPKPSQIDWWCGSPGEDGMRRGQAMRHGYIIIAPAWSTHRQTTYEYTAREHAVVLASLRDACRRFSIDTDRVFLQGHGTGGDAAWDIGLAHPDLWAGVIPIVGRSDKYCMRYWQNAKTLPFYCVSGELDAELVVQNAREYDRFMKNGFDVTVTEYRGRGHEHFIEDQLDIFDWMKRKRRNFYPEEFSAVTMRPWDNFFYWIEIGELPERANVPPANFDEKNPKSTPLKVEAKMLATNGLRASGTPNLTVYLSPNMNLDFSKIVEVSIGSARPRRVNVEPSAELLLEDARTRADRQHPFWARVTLHD